MVCVIHGLVGICSRYWARSCVHSSYASPFCFNRWLLYRIWTKYTSKDQFNNDDGQGGRRLKDSFRGKVNVFNQRCNSLRRFFHPISFLKPSRFFLSSCHSHSKTKTSFFYKNLSSLPFSLMSFILVPTGTEQIDVTVKKLCRTSAFPDSCDFYQIRQHCTRNLSWIMW